MWRSHAGRPVLAQSQDLFVGLRKGFGCWNNLVWNSATIAFVQSPNWLQTGTWRPFCFLESSRIFHLSSQHFSPIRCQPILHLSHGFWLTSHLAKQHPNDQWRQCQPGCIFARQLLATREAVRYNIYPWTWRRKGCNRKTWHVKDMENNGKWLKWRQTCQLNLKIMKNLHVGATKWVRRACLRAWWARWFQKSSIRTMASCPRLSLHFATWAKT